MRRGKQEMGQHTTYKDKVDKMLERGVQVSGLVEELDLTEVHIVDVGVDPKEALQDGFCHL